MKIPCILLLLVTWSLPVLAEPITVKFVGRVTDRSDQLASIIKVNDIIRGVYIFETTDTAPTLTYLSVKVRGRTRWTLTEDPSNSISEDADGRINLIGGNAVEGSLIEGNPVLVMQLELLRLPYTLGFQNGQLFLFYVDENGVYRTASVSFEPLFRGAWRAR